MGIKEFRERFSEIVRKGEPVLVTNHGKVVGTFAPLRPKDPERVRQAAESIRHWQEEMKAKGVDLEAALAAEGIAPDGTPLDDRVGG